MGSDRLHGGGVLCHAGLDGLGPLWGTTYKTNMRRLSPTELTKQTQHHLLNLVLALNSNKFLQEVVIFIPEFTLINLNVDFLFILDLL